MNPNKRAAYDAYGIVCIQSCLQIIRRLDENAATARRLLGLPTHEDSNDLLKRCLPTIRDDAHEMTKTSFNPEDQASADAMWQLAYDIEKAIYPHLP